MMRTVVRIALLAPALALSTDVFGWWVVPILGGVWGGLVGRAEHPVRTAAVGGALGWGLLLLWGATQGPVWLLAQKVGPILQVPGWLFVVLTLMFPLALAGAAAEIGAAVRERWARGVGSRE